MCGFLMRLSSYPEFDKSNASSCENCSGLMQPGAHSRAQIGRPGVRNKILAVISSCLLLLVLPGCGGNYIVHGAESGTLVASPNLVSFGPVPINQTASSTVSLSNGGSAPVEITQLSLAGKFFSIGAKNNLPLVIAGGGTYSLNVQFNPGTEGGGLRSVVHFEQRVSPRFGCRQPERYGDSCQAGTGSIERPVL